MTRYLTLLLSLLALLAVALQCERDGSIRHGLQENTVEEVAPHVIDPDRKAASSASVVRPVPGLVLDHQAALQAGALQHPMSDRPDEARARQARRQHGPLLRDDGRAALQRLPESERPLDAASLGSFVPRKLLAQARRDTPLVWFWWADAEEPIIVPAAWAEHAYQIGFCESNWRPDAVGKAGELGALQLHPIHFRAMRSYGYDPEWEADRLAYAVSLWGWSGETWGRHWRYCARLVGAP